MGSVTSAASIVYIPPKWSDIAPLLYHSAVLWSLLLGLAVVREILNLMLITKRENRPRNRVLLVLSYGYKEFRSALLKWQIPADEFIWNVVLPRFIVGAAICMFYCIDTISKRVTPLFYFIQVAYGIVVFAVLLYEFVYSTSPLYFVFRSGTIVECVTIPSLILASKGLWLNFNFMQAYSILALANRLEQHQIVLKNATSLTRLYFSISLELAAFVFITACGIHFFELLGDPGSLGDKTFQITWANALYFAVVTLMTVGYGDFVPFTILGRVWIVVHIIRAAYLLVRELENFLQSEKRQKRGIEAYVETIECSHVVVTGHVKWEFLKQFIEEFWREGCNANTKVLVLTSSPTWANEDWDKVIARSVFFDYHVFFVDGSPLESSDLERARVVSARAVFVMSDPHRGDPFQEDASTLKTILSIRKFGGNVPIFSFHISQNSSAQFSIAMEQVEDDIFDNLLPPAESRGGKESSTNDTILKSASGAQSTQQVVDNDSVAGSVLEPNTLDLYSGGAEEEPLLPQSPAKSVFLRNMWQYSGEDPFSMGMQRSGESLCTQELEMALLAENVFCNGLSTLVANLTLRQAPAVLQLTDRSWLFEYKLGAQCCIYSLNIPEALDGRPYIEVSTVLQDYGIVLMAYFHDEDQQWNIITVDTVLKKDMETMMISYHQMRLIPWIVENAIANLQAAEEKEQEAAARNARHPYLQTFEMEPRSRSYGWMSPRDRPLSVQNDVVGDSFSSELGIQSPETALNINNADIVSGPVFDEDVVQARPPITRAALNLHSEIYSDAPVSSATPPRSSLKTRTVKDGSRKDQERRKKNVNFERRSKPQRAFANLYHLPDRLSGHVVVCLDGESSLTSLKVLLKRIWKRRKDKKTRTKVVVIHPNFPKNFDREIRSDENDLFLVKGHSLSVQVLEQAQYKRSRAMLILATENREADSTRNTDSKAIFTVMTLDSLLDRARIYVCCMLDDEDSLRLMRAPKHPRQIAFLVEGSHGLSRSESGLGKRSASATSLSILFGSKAGSLPRGPSSLFSRNISANNRTGTFLSGDQTPYASESDELLSQAHSGSQRSDKYRSKGELSERQRYASGEMIISSFFAALLVREEAQPGYNRVIRGLLGLRDSNNSSNDSKDTKANGSWIRLLKIPEEWCDLGRPHGKNYRDTSVHLQSLGCIPIGMYRSGRAQVRWVLNRTQGGWDRVAAKVYYSEETEKSVLQFGNNPRSTFPFPMQTGASSRSSVRPEDMRFHDVQHDAEFDVDEMDKAIYECPTTKRLIEYVEMDCDNVLPYVYCFPEPYTVVDQNDGIYVLCDPDLHIPADWNVPSLPRPTVP